MFRRGCLAVNSFRVSNKGASVYKCFIVFKLWLKIVSSVYWDCAHTCDYGILDSWSKFWKDAYSIFMAYNHRMYYIQLYSYKAIAIQFCSTLNLKSTWYRSIVRFCLKLRWGNRNSVCSAATKLVIIKVKFYKSVITRGWARVMILFWWYQHNIIACTRLDLLDIRLKPDNINMKQLQYYTAPNL